MEKTLAAAGGTMALLAWMVLLWAKASAAVPALRSSRLQEQPIEDRAEPRAPFILALGLCPEPESRPARDTPPLRLNLRYFRTSGQGEDAGCPAAEDRAGVDATAAFAPVPSAVKLSGPVLPARAGTRSEPVHPPSHRPRPAEPHPKAELMIRIDQTAQRLSVARHGRPVEGLAAVEVSTGRPGAATRTPDGLFRINPHEVRERRQSHFASRLLKRPVFLTHAIQIVGGIFMHDASHGAMAYLGQKRSHGCVRVDRRKMPEIFRLVRRHRFDTRVHIFHQGS